MLARKQFLTLKAALICGVMVGALLPSFAASAQAHLDCEGPAGDPAPGTAEFALRDATNMYCAEQRKIDAAPHPVRGYPIRSGGQRATADGYRLPSRFDDVRFRFDSISIGNLATEVYRPCPTDGSVCAGLPGHLERFDPPYPVILALHGGSSRKELHWWASQPWAERGYLVFAYDGGSSAGNVQPVLNWVFNPDNPYADQMDLDRVGIAGHSIGGAAAMTVQGDPRISAIVVWDSNSGGQFASEDPTHITPTMFQSADYRGWWSAPLGVSSWHPRPRTEVDDTVTAPGFAVLRDKGVDTIVPTVRAATHLDWVVGDLAGNRYAELVNVYFHNAWFDRYLKGKLAFDTNGDVIAYEGRSEAEERAHRQAVAFEAFERLTADAFDDSADRHNFSQGFWDPVQAGISGDPVYGGNVPYRIEGKPVADRLSFYHRSVCYLSVPDYVGGGTGTPGDPNVVARVDTTPDGDMRLSGCKP